MRSGGLNFEAAVLSYRQCIFSANFDVLIYRTKVSKLYLSFDFHIVCGLNCIHYNITSCVSIASKSFVSPLCCHVQITTGLPNLGYLDRAVAQAVSSWLPRAAAQVRVRATCGVCDGQSSVGAGFLRVLRFPLPIIPPISIIIITWGWHSRPISDRSAEWTQIDYTPQYIN
jgi:hypothetical protein